MTNNFRDSDTQNLIRLHTLGLIDDKAFTEAIKKLHLKASPQPAINRPLSPSVDVPFIQRIGSGSDDLIKRYVSTGSPLTSSFTPTGLAVADLYSGSILKPEDIDTTVLAKKDYGDGVFCASGRVDVVPYSENRSMVPEHAQMVLGWIDEAWKDKVDEYNATKDDWQRIQYTDEEGNEIVEWIEKVQAEKELQAYKDFLEDNVVVEGDDAQLNGLQHIFHLNIAEGEC